MANAYEGFRLRSMPGGGVEISHTCPQPNTTVDDLAEALAYAADHDCDATLPDLPLPDPDAPPSLAQQIWGPFMDMEMKTLLFRHEYEEG